MEEKKRSPFCDLEKGGVDVCGSVWVWELFVATGGVRVWSGSGGGCVFVVWWGGVGGSGCMVMEKEW